MTSKVDMLGVGWRDCHTVFTVQLDTTKVGPAQCFSNYSTHVNPLGACLYTDLVSRPGQPDILHFCQASR